MKIKRTVRYMITAWPFTNMVVMGEMKSSGRQVRITALPCRF
jgi:hypothetical protein